MRSGAQELGTRRTRLLHFSMQNKQFGERLFAFAQQEHVEKRRKRLGIERAGATCHDKRVRLISIGGAQRNAPQIKHFKHIGGDELMRQRETHRVKLMQRRAAFQ